MGNGTIQCLVIQYLISQTTTGPVDMTHNHLDSLQLTQNTYVIMALHVNFAKHVFRQLIASICM